MSVSSAANLPAVPNESAFLGWQANAAYQSRGIDPLSLPPAEVICPGLLYPTHPQMSLKEYYSGKTGRYDHSKLRGTDEACSIASLHKSVNGQTFCLSPHLLNFVVVGDTYEDTCGNQYRGFVIRQFFRRNEKMSTLFSPGRLAKTKEGAEFPGEVESGDTSGVSREEFVLIHALFQGDADKIRALRTEAAERFVFDPTSRIFRRPAKAK